MTYYIDQSGKIEDTAKNSVIAGVNGNRYAVIVPAKEKRNLQEKFRRVGLPTLFIDYTFAICLYFIIKESGSKFTYIVDIEYPGHEKIIYNILEDLFKEEIIVFWKRIGKNSKAHDLAYKVFKKKIILGKILKSEEIWVKAKKIAGGYLNFGLSPKNRYSAPANIYKIAKKGKFVKKRKGKQ